jgi:hypothetical protein
VSGWTCQRVSAGQTCRHLNPSRAKKCGACGKFRPAKRRPEFVALDYAAYIALSGGEHCGICGAHPNGRRLDRDHDHSTGQPRGLLCRVCNRTLSTRFGFPLTPQWLRAAADYLERAAMW